MSKHSQDFWAHLSHIICFLSQRHAGIKGSHTCVRLYVCVCVQLPFPRMQARNAARTVSPKRGTSPNVLI